MENKIKNGLKTKFIGQNIVYVEETDSTNDLAKRNSKLNDGTVFIANLQTRGKGRLGREWVSQRDMGVWLTILLKPQLEQSEIPKITLAAGLAVCDTIGNGAKIKYPNDIIIGTKKVSGILTECSQNNNGESYIVCGIGINVNQKSFDGELASKATSLYEVTQEHFKMEDIIRKLLENFERVYNVFLDEGFCALVPRYRDNCINMGKQVRAIYKNKEIIGICNDITDNGEIVIKAGDETFKISSGEVSIRGIYDYI